MAESRFHLFFLTFLLLSCSCLLHAKTAVNFYGHNPNVNSKPNVAVNNFGIFSSAINFQTCDANISPYAFYNFSATGVGNQIGSEAFEGNDLGSFFQNSNSLILQGGEAKTFKKVSGNDGNVCSVKLYYRVYEQSVTPSGSFTSITLPFFENCSGTSFTAGDPCESANGDQKWQNIAGNIDLTIFAPNTYILEAYYEVEGDNNTGACDLVAYDNNSGANYKGTFTILSTGITNNSPVCENDDLTLEAPNAASYNWSGPDGFSSTDQNPIISDVSSDNAGTYTVEITTDNNCVETLTVDIAITNLPVINPPEINSD